MHIPLICFKKSANSQQKYTILKIKPPALVVVSTVVIGVSVELETVVPGWVVEIPVEPKVYT